MTNLPLAKFQMSYRWDESQHPRDDAGRFTDGGGAGGAPSFRQRGLLDPAPGPGPERRTLARMPSWYAQGSKLPELPIEYTGSRERELPADWFTAPPSITWQVPPSAPVDKHIELVGALRNIVKGERKQAIEKAQRTRQKVAIHGIKDFYTEKRRIGDLILPENAPRGAVNRAYNHAAMMALHQFGVVDYNFPKMSEPMKAELEPLVPFMRYVHRRLTQEFARNPATRGRRGEYVQAFGSPFADQRRNKFTGDVRLRLRPNQQFVKDVGAEDLEKATPGCVDDRVASVLGHAHGVIRHAGRQRMRPKQSPHVKRMLSVVDQLLGPDESAPAKPADRLGVNRNVSDHRLPLAHIVG